MERDRTVDIGPLFASRTGASLGVLDTNVVRSRQWLPSNRTPNGERPIRRAYPPWNVKLALGVHRRTLFRQRENAQLPNPQALSGWCRLLLAARMLDDHGVTGERAALELEFSSANALRNLLQRYASLSPRELRDRGGYGHLRALFIAEVKAAGASPADPPMRSELSTTRA